MRWGVVAGAALLLAACGTASDSRLESVAGPDGGAPTAGGPGDAGAAPDAGAFTDAGGAAVPDGGAPPDAGVTECAGIVPAPGAPVVATLGDSSGTCGASRPDGLGGVPLRHTTYDSSGLAISDWAFFPSKGGGPLATWAATPGGPSDLVPQPGGGFIGLEWGDGAGGEPVLVVHGIAHDGTAGPRTQVQGLATVAADPDGGLVVVNGRLAPDGKLTIAWSRFDASGAPVKTAVPIAVADASGKPAPWMVAGVSANEGRALVLWGFTGGSSTCAAAWVDRQGKVAATFEPPICRIQRLYPLAGGGLLVETFNLESVRTITAAVEDQSTSWDAPSAWIAGTSARELFLLPGSRGYALRQEGPGHDLEVIAPGGARCGTVRTAELGFGPFRVGLDGTLVEQDLRDSGCTFRWYPGLFK
jgi:hypothetical protein